jgi:hypothetical protein
MSPLVIRQRPWTALLLGSSLLAAGAVAVAAEIYVSPAESRLRSDVGFLADDLREGRGPGTKGLDAAAEYIATVFREAGLTTAPGAEGYFQNFTIPGTARLKENVALAFDLPGDTPDLAGTLKEDFTPLVRGGEGNLNDAPIVFAGYGITAKDDNLKLDYDDYKDRDVKGKVVLVIRREPQQKQADSRFAGTQATTYSSLRHKARNAAEHGAAAVLLVNDGATVGGGKDELMDFAASDGDGSGPPFVMITRALADRLLEAAGAPKLAALEAKIDEDLAPNTFPLEGVALDLTVGVDRQPIAVKNVVGVLEGSGPHADETIVVGAHYDHLGFGGSGSLQFGSKDIHNGADDNASGTALMMELARRLARRTDPLPRRVVFMAFSGEERGLLGSRHYVEHPLYPLANTVTMLNFDMVGRLNPSSEITVFGAGTSPGFEELIKALAGSQGLKPTIVEGTAMQFNASDHASFYYKDVPVIFTFTGTHADYHRPSDDTPRINFEGMARIADYAELLLLDVARRPTRPAFVKLKGGSPGPLASASRGSGVYLGTRPAYGAEGKGVKLDGVSEGSPAEKAGIKGGDVIVKFDGKEVVTIEDFMEGLSRKKPGDVVEIVVLRDGKETPLKATLATRGGGAN